MSPTPTRRHALFGTASMALISGLGGVLMPDSALACHTYASPVDGRVGCGARKRDKENGLSGDEDSGSGSQPQSPPSPDPDTSTDTGTDTGSGEPEVNGQTIRVSSASQLQGALANARAGNRIELADGSYSGKFSITKSGTNSNPILIAASSPLKAELSGDLMISGNHIIVSGLSFDGAGIVISGNNSRVTRCYFDKSDDAIYIKPEANIAEIDRNEVARWISNGIDVRGTNIHVHRNYIHGSNGGPAGNLGSGGAHTKTAKILFEYNLIENVNDGKTVYTKISDCTLRYNTFIKCQGLTNRYGRNNTYIGNWFEDCISFRVNDENCRVEGNRLIRVRLGLLVLAGDVPSSQLRSGKTYPYSDNCQIIDNDAGKITVGQTYSSMNPVYPAVNTVLSGNNGSISYRAHKDTRFLSSNQGNAGRAAVKIGRSDVGPMS